MSSGKIIMVMLVIVGVFVAGCIGNSSYGSPVTTTVTSFINHTHFITKTKTSYIHNTVTRVSTTTKTFLSPTTVIKTTTVTKEKTVVSFLTSIVTKTVCSSSSSVFSSVGKRGPVKIYPGSLGVSVVSGTTYVYLPDDYYQMFYSEVSMYYTSNVYPVESVFSALGFTDPHWSSNVYVALSMASKMYESFDYDYNRVSESKFSTLDPVELYSRRSGICGDFAAFYMMLLSYYNKPVTIIDIDFDSAPYGHAMVAYGSIAFENQYIFENLSDAFNYWYYVSGPYTAYMLILNGTHIWTSSTVVEVPIVVFTSTTISFEMMYNNRYIIDTGTFMGDSFIVTMAYNGKVFEVDSFRFGTLTESYSGGSIGYKTVSKYYDYWSYYGFLYMAPFVYPTLAGVNLHGTYLYNGGDYYIVYSRVGNEYRGEYIDNEATMSVVFYE